MHSYPLWPHPAPYAQGEDPHHHPTLDVYEPFGTAFQDTAVLICPGGGYGFLSGQEGEGFAGLFQLWGFKAFVLNYRLGIHGYRHPVMLEDAARAMRTIRARAGEYKINPNKIVVIGSSAGGHLAATLLTKWDMGRPGDPDPVERESSRPDLGILCYPVITMKEKTHAGSRDHLLGPDASDELCAQLSAEDHANADTPPCFLWHTYEDALVPVDNALLFAGALRRHGVPFELHIYEHGGHGLGMKDGIPWMDDCMRWLRRRLS